MVKINLHSITWNPNEIKEITQFNLSKKAGDILSYNAKQLYLEAKPKLPRNVNPKNHNKGIKLVDAMKVFPPEIKTKKVRREIVKYQRVLVKPKKRNIYYFVVMSGKNTYNGIKKLIKYSSPTAESFPLEKLTKQKYAKKIQNEFQNEYKMLIRQLRGRS